MKGIFLRLAIWIVLLVMIGIGYFILTTVQEGPTRASQAAALARYGDAAVQLCAQKSDQVTVGKIKLPDIVKLGAINMDDSTLFDPVAQALPAENQAKTPTELTTVLCLQEVPRIIHTDRYVSRSTSTTYTCAQRSRDMMGYLVDVSTKTQFASQKFSGQNPPECPASTDRSMVVSGDLPLASDISDWAVSKIQQ